MLKKGIGREPLFLKNNLKGTDEKLSDACEVVTKKGHPYVGHGSKKGGLTHPGKATPLGKHRYAQGAE